MTKTYQLGDIYPDWEKLERLPDFTWEELKKSHGVTEDTLFVVIDARGIHRPGSVIKLKDEDGDNCPYFI